MTQYSPYIQRQVDAGKLADGKTDVCPNCGGKGIVFAYEPIGEAIDEHHSRYIPDLHFVEIIKKAGWYRVKSYWETCWVCRKEDAIADLYARSGLLESEYSINLQSFSTAGALSQKAGAKQAVSNYIAGNANGFLTMWGNYGVGKTLLSKIIVSEMIQQGCIGIYKTAPQMVSDIRRNFGGDNGVAWVDEAIKHYAAIPLLVIDELDKVNLTDWVQETLQRIIDDRYNKSSGTVVVMNTEPAKLPSNLGYLASRLEGGIVIHVPGADMRGILKTIKEQNG